MTAPLDLKATIVPAGDSALLVTFGEDIQLSINHKVHALAQEIERQGIAGLIETVPGYATLLVHYDPLTVHYQQLANRLHILSETASFSSTSLRTVEIPVHYGGEDTAQTSHLSPR